VAGSRVDQLAQALARSKGVDYGDQLLKKRSPKDALNTIETYRDLGQNPSGLSTPDTQIADRYVEGARLRDMIGPAAAVVGPAGVAGYELIGKPALNALPDWIKELGRLIPGVRNFVPDSSSSVPLDENALARALAYASGTLRTR
jgi:hypothetical protein